MASPGYRQEMPPAGGYAPFTYKRIPAKVWLSGYGVFGVYAVVTTFSFYMYFRAFRRQYLRKVEEYDCRNALEPLIVAERDRAYLKQLKKNVEEERELMKDVPGWKVGTLYGEPIFKTAPKNYHHTPLVEEFFAHANPKDQDYNVYFAQRNS